MLGIQSYFHNMQIWSLPEVNCAPQWCLKCPLYTLGCRGLVRSMSAELVSCSSSVEGRGVWKLALLEMLVDWVACTRLWNYSMPLTWNVKYQGWHIWSQMRQMLLFWIWFRYIFTRLAIRNYFIQLLYGFVASCLIESNYYATCSLIWLFSSSNIPFNEIN